MSDLLLFAVCSGIVCVMAFTTPEVFWKVKREALFVFCMGWLIVPIWIMRQIVAAFDAITGAKGD